MSSSAALRAAHDSAVAPTVLLVDDDELMRMHLAAVLQVEGYSVQTADCARNALQILERTPGCVVLADWEMPEMDGLELCRTIRTLDRDSYVYVLLLTVRCGDGDIVAGLGAGADDYIVKGTPIEELLARLECGRRIVAHQDASGGPHRAMAQQATVPTASEDARRHVMNRLMQECRHCCTHGAPISVLAFHVDYLDCVAKRFGTNVVTDILASIRVEVSKLLLDCDWVAALNGNVFLVVLPCATLEAAQLVAQKTCVLVAAGASSHATGIPLTASVGIAALERPSELGRDTPMSLIETAVQCLEQSTLQGGDCVTTTRLKRPPG